MFLDSDAQPQQLTHFFKSDLVSFVSCGHLEEAETKAFHLQGRLCALWISIFYEGQG